MDQQKGVRQLKTGRWEVTISNKALPNGRVFRNFDDEQVARAFKALMARQLALGVIPVDLLDSARHTLPMPAAAPRKALQAPLIVHRSTGLTNDMADVLQAYLEADTAKIAPSDRPMLVGLQKSLSGPVEGLSSAWVDAWVRSMKRDERLAPGTIRKRIESVARCVDWWNRRTHEIAPPNPLRVLPKGYSAYQPGDLPAGAELPQDEERNRRLEPGEYEAIERVLQGHKRDDKERPWCKGGDAEMLLLFRLIVATGMRLREAYTLKVENVLFNLRTIHIRRSKTGAKRDIPMTRQVEAWLKEHIGDKAGDKAVFAMWGGSESEAALRLMSGRLSSRFGSLFAYAECEDLTEHDLRHEATCRWVELRGRDGGWLFRSEEVRKITGHKSEAMFMRYLSLRGSDLAARLD